MTERPMGGVGDVAASHHAVVSFSQAADLGLSASARRRQVDRHALRVVAPRVLAVHGAPVTWRQQLAAINATANGCPVVSFRSAAGLFDVDGFAPGALEATVPRGRRVRIDGVTVHQSTLDRDRDCTVVDGIVCTNLERTIVDLAGVVSPRLLERTIDWYQRTGHELVPLELMALALHRPGQRGTNAVFAELIRRSADGQVRGSWFEKLIEDIVRSPRLPPVERQHEIRAASGELIARVDLAFPSVRLAVEAHSRKFHTGTHREIVDQRRENRAMVEGWQFVYLGWGDRKSPREACRFLEDVVARRMVELGLDRP